MIHDLTRVKGQAVMTMHLFIRNEDIVLYMNYTHKNNACILYIWVSVNNGGISSKYQPDRLTYELVSVNLSTLKAKM